MTPPRVAMILAAGRGERMQPLTAARAKPTLPVLGVPMLVRAARALAAAGVRGACVNAFHAAGSVERALARFDLGGLEATLFVEERLMGSGGAFAAPAPRLAEDDLFVAVNADTLLEPPLGQLAAAATASPARIGALLVRRGRTHGYGAIVVEDGLFRRVARDDDGTADAELATYLGVAVFRRELLDGVPRDRPSHLFADVVMPRIAEGRELATVPFDGPWLEFTSPESYRRGLVRLVQRGRGSGRVPLPGGEARVRSFPGGALFAADGATASPGAFLGGAVVLEEGATASRGAMLENAVLLERATAGALATVVNGMVAGETRVEAGVTVRNAVAADPLRGEAG